MFGFLKSIYRFIGWLLFTIWLTARKQAEFLIVVKRYYFSLSFWRVDFKYMRRYLLVPAHITSQRYLKEKGLSGTYTYGATPLSSLEVIARRCRLGKDDTIYDLGCGPGKTCFFLNALLGARVVGIDIVPGFIQAGNEIKDELGVERVNFLQADFLEINYEDADALYLFGTTWSVDLMQALIKIFERDLIEGALVITIKHDLFKYSPRAEFVLEDQFDVNFHWGKDPVFVHRRKAAG